MLSCVSHFLLPSNIIAEAWQADKDVSGGQKHQMRGRHSGGEVLLEEDDKEDDNEEDDNEKDNDKMMMRKMMTRKTPQCLHAKLPLMALPQKINSPKFKQGQESTGHYCCNEKRVFLWLGIQLWYPCLDGQDNTPKVCGVMSSCPIQHQGNDFGSHALSLRKWEESQTLDLHVPKGC